MCPARAQLSSGPIGCRVVRYLTAMIVSVLVSAGPAHAADAGAPIKNCPPAKARILRGDRRAVVYETTEIRGCARGRRRSYELGYRLEGSGSGGGSSGAGISKIALAGSMVAYEEAMHGCDVNESDCHFTWLVKVRDVATGKVIHDLPTGRPTSPEPNVIGAGETTKIVVKSDGAVAWIVRSPCREGCYQVHAVDKTGERVLAAASDIQPRSLRLNGSELVWTEGGNRMSSVLE
jgi:hypothetical protein